MCCCMDQAGWSGEEGASLQDLPQHGGQHRRHQAGGLGREQGGGGERQAEKELQVISFTQGWKQLGLFPESVVFVQAKSIRCEKRSLKKKRVILMHEVF
jgi:hypothetical protein